VNRLGIARYCLHNIHIGRQLFQIQLDRLGRSPSLLGSFGYHQSGDIAVVEYFGVAEYRTFIAIDFCKDRADRKRHPVASLDILGGEHRFDTGHFLSFGVIDIQDVGM
jgi:hypothetical protein